LPDERKENAVAFRERARDWFARHRLTIERVMTDNGSAYRRSLLRAACINASIRRLRTRLDTAAPTARPNGSSKPTCANTPTPGPSPHLENTLMRCRPGRQATHVHAGPEQASQRRQIGASHSG